MADANQDARENDNGRVPAPKKSARIDRRSFLHGGVAGAAAALAPAAVEQAQAAPAPQRGTHGGRRRKLLTAPPDNSEPIQTKTATETWIEPWVWRPSDWPGEQLHLNVVENENPGPVVGFGNPNAVLFSYGGITPGPTIRMKGDEILFAKLRNMLGEDQGKTPVGHSPDPNELTPELDAKIKAAGGNTYDVIPADLREDFCLGEHTNGVHSAHVTNLHTHGLHVRPGRNPDGTHSDNVILRILSQADLKRRERLAKTPAYEFLRDPEQTDFLRGDEQVGEGNYEFHLGDVMGNPDQPHPPGTHWYHPHSHGATHNQVASGMAGYLIVEGDVDAAINQEMTGSETIDPESKTGPYDYRERLVFMQRVLIGPKDPDSENPLLSSPPTPTVNGNSQPKTITMSPGAVERWRVLNGSVDGRGFKRFMVLKGQYVYQPDNDPENPACKPKEGQEGTKRLLKVVGPG